MCCYLILGWQSCNNKNFFSIYSIFFSIHSIFSAFHFLNIESVFVQYLFAIHYFFTYFIFFGTEGVFAIGNPTFSDNSGTMIELTRITFSNDNWFTTKGDRHILNTYFQVTFFSNFQIDNNNNNNNSNDNNGKGEIINSNLMKQIANSLNKMTNQNESICKHFVRLIKTKLELPISTLRIQLKDVQKYRITSMNIITSTTETSHYHHDNNSENNTNNNNSITVRATTTINGNNTPYTSPRTLSVSTNELNCGPETVLSRSSTSGEMFNTEQMHLDDSCLDDSHLTGSPHVEETLASTNNEVTNDPMDEEEDHGKVSDGDKMTLVCSLSNRMSFGGSKSKDDGVDGDDEEISFNTPVDRFVKDLRLSQAAAANMLKVPKVKEQGRESEKTWAEKLRNDSGGSSAGSASKSEGKPGKSTPEEKKLISKYSRMLKTNIPQQSIINRMRQDGADKALIDKMFGSDSASGGEVTGGAKKKNKEAPSLVFLFLLVLFVGLLCYIWLFVVFFVENKK